MERVEPFIPWRLVGAVVAIKKPVMKLVEEIADLDTTDAANLELFKTGMGCRCANAVVEE